MQNKILHPNRIKTLPKYPINKSNQWKTLVLKYGEGGTSASREHLTVTDHHTIHIRDMVHSSGSRQRCRYFSRSSSSNFALVASVSAPSASPEFSASCACFSKFRTVLTSPL